ncbi:MAG: hypothetical protein AAF525_21505 [Pseudomonadota bacterium]
MLKKIALSLTLIGLLSTPTAYAAIWDLNAVVNGNDGGFGSSTFHASSSASLMSGANRGDITTAVSGTYNDDTGWLDVTVNVRDTNDLTGTMNLTGFMQFNGLGWLTTPPPPGVPGAPAPGGSILAADFEPESTIGFDDQLFLFMDGQQCCNNANTNSNPGNAPNSWVVVDDIGILTLWGANNPVFDTATGLVSFGSTSLGMDIRLTFSEAPPVPVPATALLVLPGLLAIRWMSRRRAS